MVIYIIIGRPQVGCMIISPPNAKAGRHIPFVTLAQAGEAGR